MRYAVLFSGQASQHPGMLPWLESEPACAATLRLMSGRLGSEWRALLHDTQRRSHNSFAQVLITGTSLAAWAALKDRLSARPALVAGYSVGELPAFACAGVFTTEQAISLATERATLMDQSVVGLKTGLLSVSGLSEAAVLAACTDVHLECAIRLNAMQSIFAGTDDALSLATLALQTTGAVCKRLEVQVASHSSWMAPAAHAFAESLNQVPFATPYCPIALNASGALGRKPIELRQALSQQIASTVQWSSCMEAIAERQVSCVLEIGPGSALARMWNDRYPDIAARSLNDFQHLQGALDWIAKHTDS
ncbi:malonate decarboxylase subunit epsilon [Rhodoferax ferrireducens]|uniref:malonate decarboxylase subunit epsilon n=1 Tax=Rhodoferax ferrireducens TaxID=192843 RepID=UPI000E0DD34D|nr:malonate decarboxylase subunit epsilon [Rhodoferax ferrireducens]